MQFKYEAGFQGYVIRAPSWKMLNSSIGSAVKSMKEPLSGFYLRFIVWERSPEWPKALSFLGGSEGMLPRQCVDMNMCLDAIWCILKQPCHIVSLEREYLLHVHRPRCVWMIFPTELLIHPLKIQYYFDSEDDYRSCCRNVSHCHQQFFSELHSPARSH